MKNLSKKWEELTRSLEERFNDEVSLKGILYLIGVQELNFGRKDFSKEDKINVLHVATCKLLCKRGYYRFDRVDKDGWPHYIELKPLKSLSALDQENLIKEAIIDYLS